jgi:AraC-like DNA-binding protein
MFYLFGISIAFFLTLLLLAKKNKSLADKILGAWLTVMCIHLCLFKLRYLSGNIHYSFLLGIESHLPLLHGPFLYLYTAAMTNQLPANKKLLLLHFIPPLLSALLFAGFYVLPAEQKLEIYKNKGAGYEMQIAVNIAAIYISGIFYVCWCYILLRRHKLNIAEQFSYTEKINLNWLRYLVYGIGVIWVVVLIGEDEWIFSAVVLFVLLLGFFGIRQAGIFSQANQLVILQEKKAEEAEVIAEKDVLENTAPGLNQQGVIYTGDSADDPVTTKKKYSKSGLTDEQAGQLQKELTRLMEKEKLFTESELTLSDLAARLNIHPNYLSQVINEKEETNFYDYINTLRIEEFKKIAALPENEKYTLLTLAYECGFNSKSSFNRYFKKVNGLSPSEYMRSA